MDQRQFALVNSSWKPTSNSYLEVGQRAAERSEKKMEANPTPSLYDQQLVWFNRLCPDCTALPCTSRWQIQICVFVWDIRWLSCPRHSQFVKNSVCSIVSCAENFSGKDSLDFICTWKDAVEIYLKNLACDDRQAHSVSLWHLFRAVCDFLRKVVLEELKGFSILTSLRIHSQSII